MSFIGWCKNWDSDFWVPFVQDDEWGTLYKHFDGEVLPDDSEYNVKLKDNNHLNFIVPAKGE